MLINGLTAEDLRTAGLDRMIVNAHISDTAGAHLQDLIPGTYHRLISATDGRDAPTWGEQLAQLLWERTRDDGQPHFTGVASVELEFCSWVDWLRTAVRKTRFLLDETGRRFKEQPRQIA